MSEKLGFSPTDEQLACASAARDRSTNVMMEAYAGCAKSSTLQLMGQEIKVPALALAFNKRIADELKPKFSSNFSVRTLNALGHMSWARANPRVQKMEIVSGKLGKLITQLSRDDKLTLDGDKWDETRQLVSLAMQRGLVPSDERFSGLIFDTPENWEDLALELLIDAEARPVVVPLAQSVLRASIKQAREGFITFDDQIYCSAMLGGAFPQFPVLMVDEAQDLSPLNHVMLSKGLRPDGRLIAVGDSRQAIYAFRGADSESMRSVRKLKPDWQDRPLTTTFRCPKVIVARQQGHAPGFKAWPTNTEGQALSYRPVRMDLDENYEGWSWSQVEALRQTGMTIAVGCRNNGPLLSLALKLIRRGVAPVILGRDIGKGLVALTRKLAPEDSTTVELLLAELESWQERETQELLLAEKHERVSGVVDRAECLRAVIDGCSDAGQVRVVIEKLFSREDGAVVLGSIHKLKGLEYDIVVHLDPWRLPSKWAKEAAQAGAFGPMQQELNLRYVVETRTKHTFIEASLEDLI